MDQTYEAPPDEGGATQSGFGGSQISESEYDINHLAFQHFRSLTAYMDEVSA